MINNLNLSESELKTRKKLVKFFRGTHERFKKGTNFKQNAENFIDALFEAMNFDEDEQIIKLVTDSYKEVHHLLAPFRGNNKEIDKFLTILEALFSAEYMKIIVRFYR